MLKYDYLIVGAGLFGAVFARLAADRGKRCLVIDRRAHIAGNIYTGRAEGIAVHKYGAHIFHTSDKAVWDFVNRFAEFVPFVNSPVADFKGRMFNLPFNMNTFVQLWGVKTPEEARRIIESQRLKLNRPAVNLEEQALSLAGRDIYETLIKEYTEKQWGRDCKNLPAFIIRRLPLRFTFDNNYFSDIYQGIPRYGYTDFVEKLLFGIEVRTNTAYQEIESPEKLAERVVYTGMIDEFFGFKFGKLAYRTLRFEDEVFDSENVQGNAVINYTSHALPYTRSIEHRHFDRFVQTGKSVVTKEYPKEWQPGDEPYYPVNDEENNQLYNRYKRLADGQERVIFGGRLGEYRYYDMDKTVAAVFAAAEKEGLV